MCFVSFVPRSKQSQRVVVDGVQVWNDLFEAALGGRGGGRQLLVQAMQHVALVVIELGHEQEDHTPFQGSPNMTLIHTTTRKTKKISKIMCFYTQFHFFFKLVTDEWYLRVRIIFLHFDGTIGRARVRAS